jgi:hypothetical protein
MRPIRGRSIRRYIKDDIGLTSVGIHQLADQRTAPIMNPVIERIIERIAGQCIETDIQFNDI